MANYASGYTESDRAELSQQRGRLAAQIKDPAARQAYIAKQGKDEASATSSKDLDISTKKLQDSTAADAVSGPPQKLDGSFKKGGAVKKTGVYKLHKGERVLNAKQHKNFIKAAIKHPGVEKAAAKKAGVSTHAYMEEKKNAPGKAGQRARFGLFLSGLNKK